MATLFRDIEDIETRKCTDVLFLMLFVLLWVGMTIISLHSYATGDLTALEFGTDYLGNRCGVGRFSDRPAVWYPRMSEDLGSQWLLLQQHPTAVVMYGLCLAECPKRPMPPIVDYGWADGHPAAKAAYWPVAMSAPGLNKPQDRGHPRAHCRVATRHLAPGRHIAPPGLASQVDL